MAEATDEWMGNGCWGDMDSDQIRDPKEETKARPQSDRDTHGRAPADLPPPWRGGDRLGDFVLGPLLGSGTSGHVYRATHWSQNQPTSFALKLLRPGCPDDLLRNKLGFRKMMSVVHPNLMRVERIHQLGPYVALSMEEIDGQTFGRHLKVLHAIPQAEAYDQLLNLLNQFASGLAAMHGRGFIHRDIKPANMMVRRDGVAKLIDYGLVDNFNVEGIEYASRGFVFGSSSLARLSPA